MTGRGVRDALAGLTLRGRAMLAAGITTLTCAVLLGQSPLVRIGLLLGVVPLLAVVLVARSRHRLGLERTPSQEMLEVGDSGEVTLAVHALGPRIGGTLLLQEKLPAELGPGPRFLLDSTGGRHPRSFSYPLTPHVRGRFTLGPATVVAADPFGLVELRRSFRDTCPLVVTPRVHPLAPIPLPHGHSDSGDSRRRSFFGGTPEDVTVREYRRGDDLRRVHWRTSARVGELMVRREEEPWQLNASVVLDTRTAAHRGHGTASSFEQAVEVAASVVMHLADQGYAIRLLDASGQQVGDVGTHRNGAIGAAEAGLADRRRVLERLAEIRSDARRRLNAPLLPGEAGLTVAVLGETDTADLLALRTLRSRATGALAVSLDVTAWGKAAPSPTEDTMTALTRDGWRTTTLEPHQDVAAAWAALDRGRPGRDRVPAGDGA